MVDSHVHLADEAFTEDLEEVIARARAAGVDRAMCILAAGNAEEAGRAGRVRSLWPEAGFAIGVHPHQAGHFAADPDSGVDLVRAAASAPDVWAIGEIGLDYYYDFAPRDVQQDLFHRQLRLARALDLPVVIHCRDAEADALAAVRAEGGVRGVMHCFTGDAAAAKRIVDAGLHLSVAGIVTFPKAAALRNAIQQTPADRLLVETDAPYLAPTPHRGKRNEPAWVRRTLEEVADLWGRSVDDVARRTTATFDALFDRARASR